MRKKRIATIYLLKSKITNIDKDRILLTAKNKSRSNHTVFEYINLLEKPVSIKD